ncbi:MAG TPA: hypothetical protein VF885_25085 [Arthrobacter sp.]
MARIERHPARTVVISAAAMLLTGALTGLGVHHFGAGMDFTASSDAISAPEISGLTALALHDTPAETALSRALGAVPGGWSADGDVQRAQAAPSPYSCPLPGKAPSTSMTRSYKAGGAGVRVTAVAYTAGLGAEAMTEANGRALVCAGVDGPVGWDKMYGDAPGAESYLASVTKAGNVLWTASFRRGDVIIYLTGASASTLQSLALGFDRHLSSFLDKVCANTGSGAADAARSLWASATYEPFTVETQVKVESPGLPKPADSTGVKAVSLPGPDLDTDEVTPAEAPSHPVWPKMPAPVKRPTAPESPPENPITSRTVQTLSADATGPGCGWSFTGTAAPVFNSGAAAAANTALQGKATAELTAGTGKWSASVLAYWKAYAAYKTEAEAYSKYAGTVTTVNAAWDVIAGKWEEFNARMGEYEAGVQARDEFLASKAQAQKTYISQLERCAAEASRPKPAPSATPSPAPSPSTSPTASPVPTATATASPAPVKTEGCSVTRPEILDKTEPPTPVKPVEPADPRPADARG